MKKKIIIAVIAVVGVALIAYFAQRGDAVDPKACQAAFPGKTWFYSTDDGKNWTKHAELGLKTFGEDGNPIHVSPAWISGEWKDENTIVWEGSDGSESIWKCFDVQQTESEKTRTRAFAASFPTKRWYYSQDNGGNWNELTMEDLKGFDQNGNPIHVSEAWIVGEWKDENTISWIAVNGSTSIWKAFDTQP